MPLEMPLGVFSTVEINRILGVAYQALPMSLSVGITLMCNRAELEKNFQLFSFLGYILLLFSILTSVIVSLVNKLIRISHLSVEFLPHHYRQLKEMLSVSIDRSSYGLIAYLCYKCFGELIDSEFITLSTFFLNFRRCCKK